MNNWRDASFEDCASLVRDTCDPSEALMQPYVGLEHIAPGTLMLEGHGWGSDVSSTKTRFREGDILFGKLRPYFRKVVRPRFGGVCSTDIWVVRARDGMDQGFLYYWMASQEFVDTASRGSEGTKMPRAKWDFLARLQRKVPPLHEQQAIASILGTLDDKIELNLRMNETLEALARALFKSWFVDFDPVRAKMEGRQPFGMDDETAALFPDSFEDSVLGEIPKGWIAGSVGDDFEIIMGQSPPGKTYNEIGEGLPFYQGRRDFKFRYPDLRVYCSAPKRTARSGDTLVSVRAPVGDVNMAESLCCVGRGVAAVRHRTGSRSYTYYAMHSLKAYFERFESEGTVFGAVNKKGFLTIPFLLPPPALVEAFESLSFPLEQRIEVQEKQSRTLAAIRDALLPKLLSGEVRVGQAEEIVEDVV